jgi:glyoxylase-like metal-dependent hydrolase (beta-lactamase superfamily II)
MPAASEIQHVAEDLLFWQAYDPTVKTELCSCAVRASGGWILIDPIDLKPAALRELADVAPPVGIVLTSGNHARAAAAYRERFSVPILAHAEAASELGLSIDREIAEGDVVADGASVITLPGAAPGEIALHLPGRSLHVGDALINAEHYGFSLLPDKYCTAPKTLRTSLQKLLPLDFAVLTFAHGLPLVENARQRLAQLLA